MISLLIDFEDQGGTFARGQEKIKSKSCPKIF
jgi:hypothetical protein